MNDRNSMCPPVENVAAFNDLMASHTTLLSVVPITMQQSWQHTTMVSYVFRIGQFEYTIIHSLLYWQNHQTKPLFTSTNTMGLFFVLFSNHPRPFSDKTSIWKDQFGGSTCLWRTLFNEESRVQFCWKRMRAVQWQYLPTRIKYLKTDQLQGTGLWFSDCRVLILERIIDKDA